MKQPKKLKRSQKAIISSKNLDAEKFGLVKEDDEKLILFCREDGLFYHVEKRKKGSYTTSESF